MMPKEVFLLFLSLGLGYVLCVIAKKEKSVLKTLGYTLGIATIVMTLLAALMASQNACMNKMIGGKMGCPMMKHHMPMKGMK